MKRKIITIDEEKCIGCGLCVNACHEGAIQLIDGKARLISESYCDGLGACLPACPTDAITIEEREAEAFDEEYAIRHQQEKQKQAEKPAPQPASCSCPGTRARVMQPVHAAPASAEIPQSQLRQWPCQIKLAPVNAPFFHQANLLIAASCSAFAYANTHSEFMRNRVTLIGCPKLDGVDYSEKLTEILRTNDIKSVTVLRMEVPCCGGIVSAVKTALLNSGKMIPWNVITLSTDGRVLED